MVEVRQEHTPLGWWKVLLSTGLVGWLVGLRSLRVVVGLWCQGGCDCGVVMVMVGWLLGALNILVDW